MTAYRVIVHGIGARERAEQLARIIRADQVDGSGVGSHWGTSVSVEPDDVATVLQDHGDHYAGMPTRRDDPIPGNNVRHGMMVAGKCPRTDPHPISDCPDYTEVPVPGTI